MNGYRFPDFVRALLLVPHSESTVSTLEDVIQGEIDKAYKAGELAGLKMAQQIVTGSTS